MITLRPAQLKSGMRLGHDLYRGSALYLPKGSVLKASQIDHLQEIELAQPVVIESDELAQLRSGKYGYRIGLIERRHGELCAEGSLTVETFVAPDSQLRVLGDVEIRGDVLNRARITCTGSIRVHGRVAGAALTAGGEIDVNEAGSRFMTPTLLACHREEEPEPAEPQENPEIAELDAQMRKLNKSLASIKQQMADGQADARKSRPQIMKLVSALHTLQKRSDRLKTATGEQDIKKATPKSRPAIRIRETCLPEVRVRIGTASHTIPETCENLQILLRNSELLATSERLETLCALSEHFEI